MWSGGGVGGSGGGRAGGLFSLFSLCFNCLRRLVLTGHAFEDLGTEYQPR